MQSMCNLGVETSSLTLEKCMKRCIFTAEAGGTMLSTEQLNSRCRIQCGITTPFDSASIDQCMRRCTFGMEAAGAYLKPQEMYSRCEVNCAVDYPEAPYGPPIPKTSVITVYPNLPIPPTPSMTQSEQLCIGRCTIETERGSSLLSEYQINRRCRIKMD